MEERPFTTRHLLYRLDYHLTWYMSMDQREKLSEVGKWVSDNIRLYMEAIATLNTI